MNMLKPILWAIAAVALLFTGACVEDAGQDTQHTTELLSEPAMEKKPEAPGEFSVVRDVSGAWRFQLIGDKGAIFLTSEDYVEKPSALNGVLSVEENGVYLDKYVVSETAPGEWRFVLRAANNQVIGDSPMFRSQADAESAVQATRDLIAGIVQFKAAMTNGARFELWRDQDSRQWLFALRAADGRTLLESEDYEARTGAVNGIESVRENGKDPARYAVIEVSGQFYFTLKAANGQEIGRSTAYAAPGDAEAGVAETNQLLLSERVANPW